jgi:hypothetical protein
VTLQGAPSISRRGAALAVLAVIALHLALIALLNGSAAWQPRRGAPPTASPRVTLRLIPLPVPPAPVPRVEAAAPRPNARMTAPIRTHARTPERLRGAPVAAPVAAAAINATRPEAVSHAEPAASAPEILPSLMDTEATRRAIRASARQPSLTDQLAHARDEPRRASVDERLGAAVRSAAKGDCLKGEFPGAGMGLLSLPFLAAALSSGNCAK